MSVNKISYRYIMLEFKFEYETSEFITISLKIEETSETKIKADKGNITQSLQKPEA